MNRRVSGCASGLLEPDAVKAARPVLRGEGGSDVYPPTRHDTGHGLPTVKEGAIAHDINKQHRLWDRRAAGGDA